MSSDWATANFAKLSTQHFEPLCEALGLGEPNSVVGAGYAVSSAADNIVRVFFEHDRGLCNFALGPAGDNEPLCSVDVAARRFPPVRLLRQGEQRLSLGEQAQLVQGHWKELQHMFGPALAETREWLAEVHAALTAKYTGGA